MVGDKQHGPPQRPQVEYLKESDKYPPVIARVRRIETCRDGGTMRLTGHFQSLKHGFSSQWCYIDFRIGTETPGVVYDGYPDMANAIEDKEFIRKLKQEVEQYGAIIKFQVAKILDKVQG